MEDQFSNEFEIGDDIYGYFTSNFLSSIGWNNTGNTFIDVCEGNSIDERVPIEMKGRIGEDFLNNLPVHITLEDIASSIYIGAAYTEDYGLIYQEKKMTSGPTNVLLFSKDWK